MTEPRAKFTPQERLAKTLKQGSTIPELSQSSVNNAAMCLSSAVFLGSTTLLKPAVI